MANAFSNIGSGVPIAQTSTPQTSGLLNQSTPIYTPSTPVKSVTSPSGTITTFHAPTPGVASSNNGSVVDYLNSTGKASDYNTRAGLAQQYGISGYSGTADQNTALLNALKGGSSSGTTSGVLSSSPLNTQTSSPSSSGYAGAAGPVTPGNADGSTNLTGLTGTPPASTATPYTVNPGLQGQLITGLANQSQQPGAGYQAQLDKYNETAANIANLKQQEAQQTHDINTSGTWTSRALGEQGQANIQNAATELALSGQLNAQASALGAANTQQGLNQSALTGAISANAPQFPSYGSQVYDPASGTFKTGTGGTLQDAVSTVADRVKSGQMSYADAISSLSGYGQGGTNALLQALGPNFNVAQSNTLASQQGSIGPALQYANTALSNLQNAVSGLSSTQNTNVPIINQISQGISTTFGVGSQAVQNYRAAVAEARGAIQKVLASVSGGTPTDYVGQSNALLPDNATPNQIAAAVETLKTLGTAKASIYGNPGAAGNSTASPSGPSLYSW